MRIMELLKLSSEFNLEKIREQVLDCKKCPLYKSRINTVFGEGNPKAKIMFIGEAPGANEDKTGVPFCGRAGNILDELLDSISLNRKDIFIANVLKCRPPKNRNPNREEIIACTPYLSKQIKLINPIVICPLGNYSTSFVLEKYKLGNNIDGISKLHGKLFEINTLSGKLKIFPLYHPAVVAYKPSMKEILSEDFKKLKIIIE